ncbi:cell division suppressor protein YneA [Sporosarcina obsidiansis]|uniref:cell division suppressor protein YneA n=1 Tax=Sporosarcina obsidiansis TaxID=2660748 RepID=UPI00129ADDB2|nr:hypothetical protein [Sporosarcina obsidiansis]
MKILKENLYFVVLLLICISFAAYQLDKLSEEDAYMEIIIDEGDTLWGLAANYSEGTPPYHWIEQVKTLNDLQTDQIISGELLRLPVKINNHADHRMAEVGEEAR